MNLKPQIVPGWIVLDGPIGAGKTTLIHKLKEELSMKGASVAIIEELIPDNLEDYYADPKKNAFSFQKKFVKLLAEQLNSMWTMLKLRRYDYILSDRYYASTRGFTRFQRAMDFLSDAEMEEIYADLVMVIRSLPIFPEFYIFMMETNDVCLERIKKRARSGETDERMLSLTNDYVKTFNLIPYAGQGPTTKLDLFGSNKELLADPRELEMLVSKIHILYIQDVVLNSTKCKLYPQEVEVELSTSLSNRKSFQSQQDALWADCVLLLSGIHPNDVVPPTDEEGQSQIGL